MKIFDFILKDAPRVFAYPTHHCNAEYRSCHVQPSRNRRFSSDDNNSNNDNSNNNNNIFVNFNDVAAVNSPVFGACKHRDFRPGRICCVCREQNNPEY